MDVIDNKTKKLYEKLVDSIKSGDKISIASSCFSMYAFNELKEQLKGLSEFRFMYTNSAFVKESGVKVKRGFQTSHIEESVCGNEFEAKLRNELTQKAIAHECAEWLRSENVKIRANKTDEYIGGFATIQNTTDKRFIAYSPIQGFTTVDLGCSRGKNALNITQELELPYSKQYLEAFNSIWNDKKYMVDVKEAVIRKITSAYAENAPEFIYFIALNNIFSEFLSDINDEDFFANEKTGFKDSYIWNKLYDFQKDAALAIINKLERYNGCILADSVGLGKTFTALSVIKYYESRNKNVLVLCPKKLSENWKTFNSNSKNNPLVGDRLRYDVLYHTDLGRSGESNGINLDLLNWSNYDLVVIDESHNFRNGGSEKNGKKNRYQFLLDDVIRSGVKTKVLMLSATPVNNRFNDLKNQLELAYENGDVKKMEEQLDTKNTIDGIFKKTQNIFNKWSSLKPEQRTTERLIDSLDFDFFELLDSVTIARSRKHIKSYYDMDAIGAFPQRLSPISVSPSFTDSKNAPDYDEIFGLILQLTLAIYTPSHYILPEKKAKYTAKLGRNTISPEIREQGLRRLMAINLMKRLESSVYSFKLTLERMDKLINDALDKIDSYVDSGENVEFSETLLDDVETYSDDEFQEEDFTVGKKIKINLDDMNVLSWKITLNDDVSIIRELLFRIESVTPEHDTKLNTLLEVISNKIENPINENNRKVLVFTAFADTAEYLYDAVSKYSLKNGLNAAMVTGTTNGVSTIKGLECDYNTVLTCFSPVSKSRDAMEYKGVSATANIDILIGTDCISEGQNLQDCDYCINYDIHWNPVRIIQRYGRIDRIGSTNRYIQLVNFWPDVSLDEYINLKQRVETRMKIVNITATPEEKVLTEEEKIDLEYRKVQLEKLKTDVVDVEDMTTGVTITDLGLNEFRLDLIEYIKSNRWNAKGKTGLYAVVNSTDMFKPGMIFVLKNISSKSTIKNQNRLHPFYLVYIMENGIVTIGYQKPKDVLTSIRNLCKGVDKPDISACKSFNDETKNGAQMTKYTCLLNKAIESIASEKEKADTMSLFRSGGTNFNDKVDNLDNFELICFLVVK